MANPPWPTGFWTYTFDIEYATGLDILYRHGHIVGRVYLYEFCHNIRFLDKLEMTIEKREITIDKREMTID